MKKTKIDNKGFSLVELIIVIAIMAILAAALAPQLMKYIDKSRKSSDDSTAGSIKNSVNAALSEDEVYKECKGSSGASAADKTTTVEITFSNDTATYSSGTPANLKTELQSKMPDIKPPKQSSATKWEIKIVGKKNDGGFTVEVNAK